MASSSYDYDFVVIGGGSGGMAAAKMAAKNGASVALFDYVKPSTQGSKWGLGGTCVNVGCVPKKLFHYAGLLGQGLHDAKELGWNVPDKLENNWQQLRSTIQNYVKSLNYGYKGGLRSNKVKYINALASFTDEHTIQYTLKGEAKTLTGGKFLIATGGRPTMPDNIPGAMEYGITSDDIFSLENAPGKTLCVGGGYIALECAGFLTELGYQTDVAVRSVLLRGFDRQCAEMIHNSMYELGTTFLHTTVPKQLVKREDGRLDVTLINTSTNAETVEVYDTVLFAVGRTADTKNIGLENAGVVTLPNGKLETQDECTNVPHVFAVGDILQGKPELTPVAIQAGELLSRRLFAGATETMNYELVPTAVFTPYEYGTCGISEETAEERFGKDNVETYLFQFSTLEFSAVHRKKHPSRYDDPFMADITTPCLAKLVCLKTENERVVGFHFVGPNAGEVTQGFALGLHLGATKEQFTKLVGIHPTDAEAFTALDTTRASGEDFVASGGCGGGKCG